MADITVTITIPEADVPDLLEAMALRFDFETNGGGLTKAQFAHARVIVFLKEVLRQYRRNIAEKAALTNIVDQADGIA